MDQTLTALGLLAGAAVIFAAIARGWWHADGRLRAPGRRDAGADPARAFLRAELSPDLPAGAFVAAVARSGLVGLFVLLVAYFMAEPRFFAQMVEAPVARGPALGFLAVLGLPAVLLSTGVSFLLLGRRLEALAVAGPAGLGAVLVLDAALRLALFAVAAGGVFLVLAAFGSFGGAAGAALRAVPATIATGLGFGGLAGVCLYASALGAFPLHILLAMRFRSRSAALRRALDGVPALAGRPIRAGAVLVGLAFALAALVASAALGAPAPG